MKVRGDAGFTLVEILVAFAIMAMTIIVGMQVFSEGLSRITRSGDADERLARSRAALAAAQLGTLSQGQQNRPGLEMTVLEAEKVPWTEFAPVRVTIKDEKGLVLETIIIAPQDHK